jgi:copper(I)-binding protein
MQISGGGEDDVLASAESAACSVVELHETTMSDGVMSMQHLPQGIPIPAGETVSLEPGGLHVMCMGVERALVEGENIDVQLQFESAGVVTVSAEIREG